MKEFLKAAAAAVVAGGTAVATALDDGEIDWSEAITVVLAVIGSAGVVYYISNGRGAIYAKAIAGALTAGLTSLGVSILDEVVTTQEWTTAIVAAVVSLGIVYAVPNDPPTEEPVNP